MFDREGFIDYVGAKSGNSYASGLARIESLYSVGIDAEYDKDKCEAFEIDDVMLYHEFLSLMDSRLWDSEPRIYSAPRFAFMEFADCRELYLHFFSKLATFSLEE